MNRRTPLYDWHVAHQARMVPFGGWDMPVQYTSVIEEHKSVRTAAGLFDISHMARLSFGGSGALALLENVFTNSVASMKDGQVRYGLICNPDGGILDDVLVYKWPNGCSMVVNASNREKIVGWLKQQMSGMDVQLHDQTESTAMIAIQGPNAVQLVQGKYDADVTQLKYYFATPTRWRGRDCIVSRTGYTGEDGFEVILPADQASAAWEEYVACGARPCGLGARDTLRLEAAMPLYGHELSESINPIDAGLGWAVKMEKAFIGRDALKRLGGERSVRIGLVLEGKRAAREGSPILSGPTPIGRVTSGSYVPHLEQSIAMGYVPSGSAAVGTDLSVDIRGSVVPARVVKLPFYQRPKP